MPLLDHFHPPSLGTRHWESFHARRASALADQLDRVLLPRGYFAEIQVHVGGRIEVDVGAFDDDSAVRVDRASEDEGPSSVATLAAPSNFPDIVEMLVYNEEAGPVLVGAVEFISPGNKDRPEALRAFAAKCATYPRRGSAWRSSTS